MTESLKSYLARDSEKKYPLNSRVVSAPEIVSELMWLKDALAEIDLSEKNPLIMLRNDTSLTTLLEIFSRGTHRVLVEGPEQQVKGIITDGALVKYFASNVRIKHVAPELYLTQTFGIAR
jgi:CBS domain-containing protein